MIEADSVHSTPLTNTSALSEVANGLFELESPLLRIRDLLVGVTTMVASAEITKEARDAIDAVADTILNQVQEVLEERTRLCELAREAPMSHGAAEGPQSPQDPFDVYGPDSSRLSSCAEWHVARAERQAASARLERQEAWRYDISGDFPDDYQDGLDRMKSIEDDLQDWTPVTVMGARQLLEIIIAIQTHLEDCGDPTEYLAQGPVLHYMRNLRNCLKRGDGQSRLPPPL